jgi:DNA-binding SARP family transcriptional activator
MIGTIHLSAYLERLLHRVELLETPLIQIWGWPGSGKSGLLSAFLAVHEGEALGLSTDELADGAAVRAAVDAAWKAEARWLVALGDPAQGNPGLGNPGNRLREAARRLRPGQRLIFAGERRARGVEELPASVIPPQELLATPGEISALWHLLAGEIPDPGTAARLHAASDGWYRPVQLALEATGGGGLGAATPEQLLEIAPVRFFLRHEVAETFSAAEMEALLAAPEERAPEMGRGEEGWRLLDERGFWLEGAEPPQRDRMPRLLAAYLARERRRRGIGRPAPASQEHTPEPDAAPPEVPVPRSAVYSLGLLGAPFARLRDAGGERDLDCRLRRSFQVLAYLGSAPGMEAEREELIEAVWPTEGEHTIDRNFHPTLSHLRRALEAGRKDELQPLLFRGGVYRLNPEIGWEVDAVELKALVEKGKKLSLRGDLAAAADAWRRAWTLYRGPFLQGHYEAWVTERRESYQRQHLEMLRELGDIYLRLQRPDDAMDAYRSILVEDPLQERIHLALMQVYADQGRRDMVRRQYDRLCTLLLEELGVEPLTETTREYHRLMS